MAASSHKLNAVFLHPDLGIGGAERLVVDAALALQQSGHIVTIFTSHHDVNHCFIETKNGTLKVVNAFDWLPRSILGRCVAFCCYLRMFFVACYVLFFSGIHPDIVFVDLVSVVVPLFKMARIPVLFYCHFPDQLLTKRETFLKMIYRLPLDFLEEITTNMADRVVVNSKFTAKIFRETFTRIKTSPTVLYPSFNKSILNTPLTDQIEGLTINDVKTMFVSINRYERKKDIGLAIKAMSILKSRLPPDVFSSVHLVIAGGYDTQVIENVDYHRELEILTDALSLTSKNVTFVRSISDSAKRSLLHSCTCLLYTPTNEHFGIVPLEAMAIGRPVIASNTGGPTETIVNSQTGFLCDATPEDFADKMEMFVRDKDLAREMGLVGRRRVMEIFGFDRFCEELDEIVISLVT